MSQRSLGERKIWSSTLSFYLATIGAAVGLGSIWRFPYLAGTQGGGAFIVIFALACTFITVPMMAAEFLLGRRSRRSPIDAAGRVAREAGRPRWWNVIGVLGSVAALMILSYYSVIAGWVLAYAWKSVSGQLVGLSQAQLADRWSSFIANPWEIGAWHLAFLSMMAIISARGLHMGIERANRIRAPALLILLGVLVAYALIKGDSARGMVFAFAPDFSRIDAKVVLAAVGQAFYATGVGMAIMIAYGAYAPVSAPLIRSAVLIAGAILVVSVMASMMVFPLVFRFHMDPAQGPALVFNVLPAAFAEMPGGRLIGTLFFVLLVLAALTPSIAALEPSVAWLEQRWRLSRNASVALAGMAAWMLGLGSVLSFNWAAHWHPLGILPSFRDKTFFDVMDYVSANILLPLGALLTSIFVGWRLPRSMLLESFAAAPMIWQRLCIWMLRFLCPVAIVAILMAALR